MGQNIKKRKVFSVCLRVYWRFLSTKIASTAPTAMIAMIMPATAGTKYCSVTVSGSGSTTGGASGSSMTPKAVCAYDA